MFISRNDGMFNNNFNHSRDTIVNLHSFIQLGRKRYTKEQLDRIAMAKLLK
jgi:hypothetical protein